MILLDTSVLIDAITGPRRAASALRSAIEQGERIQIPSLALFEWRRGPRTPSELAHQEALFPSSEAIPFGHSEAILAAELYRRVGRARSRQIDLAIAACAIVRGARLWTQNVADFRDIPALTTYTQV